MVQGDTAERPDQRLQIGGEAFPAADRFIEQRASHLHQAGRVQQLHTNGHVIEDAESISIRLQDGRIYKAAVRGVDPQSDVAVIKIDAKGLPVATLADASKTQVGEFAIAIGAPFGFDFSVTFGHVSAKSRSNIIDGFEGGNASDVDLLDYH